MGVCVWGGGAGGCVNINLYTVFLVGIVRYSSCLF